MIAREVKRKKLVKKYAAKRKSLLELGIDVGLLANQEVFIEILVYAEIN